MIRGAWMYRREDDAVLKICCTPKQNDKPCADSERAQKWRMSLASLLVFTVLLSDHLWLCAGVKLRSKDKNSRKYWNNATDGDHAVQNEGNCGLPLSSLTKSAAPSPHCTEARNHQNLESSCTTLHWKKRGAGSSLTTHNRSSLSPQLLLTYFRNFSLSFCGSYTISDLLVGMASPDGLNCSLQNLIWDLVSGGVDEEGSCNSCIQAYMRLDQHAQEKYEEFDFLFLKYLSEDYSVRSRTEDCKVELCSQFCHRTDTFTAVGNKAAKWPTKPGYVQNISVPPRASASTGFPASSTAWRFKPAAPLCCLTMGIWFMGDYPVSSVQVSISDLLPCSGSCTCS
uniref:NALCN channel auxiliary factor 2 n=1 Tax=Paramormyrops kingsleyae TaxID=1676925 RepID=A0A3B3SW58_9TELE